MSVTVCKTEIYEKIKMNSKIQCHEDSDAEFKVTAHFDPKIWVMCKTLSTLQSILIWISN